MKKLFIPLFLLLVTLASAEAFSLPCSFFGKCSSDDVNIFIQNSSSESCEVDIVETTHGFWDGTINYVPRPNTTSGVYYKTDGLGGIQGVIRLKCASHTAKLSFKRPVLSKKITANSSNPNLVKLDRCESAYKKTPAVCYFEILP